MLRTKNCSELTRLDVGKQVELCGWVSKVRNLGSLVFFDLRDRYGITQICLTTEQYAATTIKSEYCLYVQGVVVERLDQNDKIPTGEIEIKCNSLRIFSASELPPFIIADKSDALEETRLKERYLDLRRPILQKNLVLRSALSAHLRSFLVDEGFLEIETPTLIKSTPEGARDYLVPSRTRPGSFYALPQSPQIYKQLLMIAGMDRYFQFARCYRDEDLRADRQPEFTQVDVEMSFVEREDVLDIIERSLKFAFKKTISVDLPDFKRISYADCLAIYGSDKPDIRYELHLHDLDEIFVSNESEIFKGSHVKGMKIPLSAEIVTRKLIDQDNLLMKNHGLHSAFHLKFVDGELKGSITKILSERELDLLKKEFCFEEDDVLVIDVDASYEKLSLGLGALRRRYADLLGLVKPGTYAPLFVIDWPIFGREEGRLVSLSNPFTRPRDEDLKYLDTDPTKALSYAYDTVLNGVELSSGSLRIYDSVIQEKIFSLLGFSQEETKKRFGFFVDALKYGTPPHGGFAFGLERLAMIICQTENIRDVIAFPKNLQAVCPMADAPSKVEKEALDILKIKIEESKYE